MALALLRGLRNPPPYPRDPTGATAPRTYLFDEMFEPRYDESILGNVPSRLRAASRLLPPWLQLALEVHRRRDEYDVIVTWGERLSLALMAIQRLARDAKPHVAMMYWFSKPNVRLPIRAFGRSLHAIVTWSSVQRDYAVEKLGFPEERIHLIKHFVDQLFWSPRALGVDTVSSAGKEMRDYPTLLAALRGTSLRCHVATDRVLIAGSRIRHRTVRAEALAPLAPDKVTIGKVPATELRELYARSRFVVVPLLPSDTDNGVSVILEAMAMGKPVICSRTRGQVDVIRDGWNGLLVPVGDPDALRQAMLGLWNDPARAELMGRRARAYVEEHHTLDKFCRDVKAAVEASLAGGPAIAAPPRFA
jgi:glycosyltransferase involved in cell wall biosynthesis